MKLRVFLLTLILITPLILSVTARDPKVQSNNTAAWSIDYSNSRNLCRMSNGSLYAISTAGQIAIMVNRSLDNGKTWKNFAGYPANLSSPYISKQSSQALYPSICSDSRDNLYAFWTSTYIPGVANHRTAWCVYNKSTETWGIPKNISQGGPDYQDSPMGLVDKYDHIWLVQDHVDATPDNITLWKSTNLGTTWTKAHTAIAQGYESQYPTLATDTNGDIFLIWVGSHAGSAQKQIRCFTWWSSNTSWNSHIWNITAVAANAYSASAVTTTNNTLWIAFTQQSGANYQVQIKHYTINTSTWSGTTLITTAAQDTFRISTSLDRFGNLYIIWNNATNKISGIKRTSLGGSWSSIFTLTTTAVDCRTPKSLFQLYPRYFGTQTDVPQTGIIFLYFNNTNSDLRSYKENVTWEFSPVTIINATGIGPTTATIHGEANNWKHLWSNKTYPVGFYLTAPGLSTINVSAGTVTTISRTFTYSFTNLTANTTYTAWAWILMNTTHGYVMSTNFTMFSTILRYIINIFWENSSYHVPKMSKMGNHTLIVHYDNETKTNIFNSTKVYMKQSIGDFAHIKQGYILINSTKKPKFFEFKWNSTNTTSLDVTTTERYYGYDSDVINLTTTYIQLVNTPITVTNVTCCNMNAVTTNLKLSYPTFGLSGNTIIIYPYTSKGFTQVNITYTYKSSTSSSPYTCTRYHTVTGPSDTKFSFYIITNKPTYATSTSYFNDSLVRYSLTINDATSYFTPVSAFDVYATIYQFDQYGNKLIIDSQYIDTTNRFISHLLCGKVYYFGITSVVSGIHADLITNVPTGAAVDQTININANSTIVLREVTNLTFRIGWKWSTGGVYFSFTNPSSHYPTTHAYFYLYDWNNITMGKGALRCSNTTTNSFANWSFNPAQINRSFMFTFIHTTSEGTENYTGYISSFVIVTHHGHIINWLLNSTFGLSPVYDPLNPQKYVQWVDLFILGMSFIVLCALTGAGLSGDLGVMGMGITAAGLGAMISGALLLWIGAGTFLIVVGFIDAYRKGDIFK